MSYTDTDTIQDRLRISGKTLSADEQNYLVSTVFPAVEEYINVQTGVAFGNNTATDVYVSGEKGKMLVIPTMSEVNTVTSLNNDTESPVTGYKVFPQGKDYIYAIRNGGGDWTEGFENYKINGKLGYKTVPADIQSVATDLAINGLNADKTNLYKSEKVGDWQVVYNESDNTITDEHRATLLRYRRLSRDI